MGRKKGPDFILPDIDLPEYRQEKHYDLKELYRLTYEELGLQQSKRDTLISLYIALFSFIIPFTLSMNSQDLPLWGKGVLFCVMGIIGCLMAGIIIRYRMYKEVYWLACRTISQLKNYDTACINKALVQGTFYKTMQKKGKSYVRTTPEGKKFRWLRFIQKNTFSAETGYFMIHSLLTAIIMGLGIALVLYGQYGSMWGIGLGIGLGAAVLAVLMLWYYRILYSVYAVLVDGKDASFNHAFATAWQLHFYPD